MRIGIFDSGIGGLSVLNDAMRMLAGDVSYLYYADTAHVPYGTKSTEEIRAYAHYVTDFLLKEGAECIVIACNTATSAAVKSLRETFSVPIVGMEPAVKPAIAYAEAKGDDARVLVLATPLTLREEKLRDLITRYDRGQRVDLCALPKLVEYAEAECFDEAKVDAYLTEAFAGLDKRSFRAVVPGCTHFLYFVPQLKKHFDADCAFIDGNGGTVRRVAEVTGLAARAEGDKAQEVPVRFFFSGGEARGEEEAKARRLMRRLMGS